MQLPKELTTVTPFSKYLAMVLFVLFPFIGFYLGMNYQQAISSNSLFSHTVVIPSPTISSNLYIEKAYQKDNDLWVSYSNGIKKKIFTAEFQDTNPTNHAITFFLSSDHKYLVWFTQFGIIRYIPLTDKIDTLASYSDVNTQNFTFFQSIYRIGDSILFLDIESQQIVTVSMTSGRTNTVTIPTRKSNVFLFTRMELSPDSKKVLLGVSHGGPANGAESAIINVDGTGFINLPASFEEYGAFVRLWRDDSQAILESSISGSGNGDDFLYSLLSFDTTTGQQSTFLSTPRGTIIDACKFHNHILYCKLRTYGEQQGKWNEWKNGTFISSFQPASY